MFGKFPGKPVLCAVLIIMVVVWYLNKTNVTIDPESPPRADLQPTEHKKTLDLRSLRCRIGNRLRTPKEDLACEEYHHTDLANITTTYQDVLANGRDRLFVDVGANSGQETVEAAKHGMIVIAFEPVSRNQRCWLREVTMNNVTDSVTLIKGAVSDKPGKATFFVPNTAKLFKQQCPQTGSLVSQDFWTGTINVQTREEVVPIYTLDQHIDSRPYLLHADVQGHEFPAFKGGKKLFTEYPPVWLHFEFWPAGMKETGYTPLELHEWLVDHNYVCYTSPSSVEHQAKTKKFAGLTDFIDLVEVKLGYKPFPHRFTDVLCRLADETLAETVAKAVG
eukprot:TRINITY_DN75387_c0_g1_i1.p1 TRINITY_DN75387_c0_g1~~TRINITY_DN75387_c0_g1_i1.p1  ORF type:complete len:334 (-),score=16.20 TRINITY_DN75387_c0_g1_i1:17-1018(-)